MPRRRDDLDDLVDLLAGLLRPKPETPAVVRPGFGLESATGIGPAQKSPYEPTLRPGEWEQMSTQEQNERLAMLAFQAAEGFAMGGPAGGAAVQPHEARVAAGRPSGRPKITPGQAEAARQKQVLDARIRRAAEDALRPPTRATYETPTVERLELSPKKEVNLLNRLVDAPGDARVRAVAPEFIGPRGSLARTEEDTHLLGRASRVRSAETKRQAEEHKVKDDKEKPQGPVRDFGSMVREMTDHGDDQGVAKMRNPGIDTPRGYGEGAKVEAWPRKAKKSRSGPLKTDDRLVEMLDRAYERKQPGKPSGFAEEYEGRELRSRFPDQVAKVREHSKSLKELPSTTDPYPAASAEQAKEWQAKRDARRYAAAVTDAEANVSGGVDNPSGNFASAVEKGSPRGKEGAEAMRKAVERMLPEDVLALLPRVPFGAREGIEPPPPRKGPREVVGQVVEPPPAFMAVIRAAAPGATEPEIRDLARAIYAQNASAADKYKAARKVDVREARERRKQSPNVLKGRNNTFLTRWGYEWNEAAEQWQPKN